MAGSLRKVKESPVYQGASEQIAYRFEWAAIGTPSTPTVYLYDSKGTDVSSTKLTGVATTSGTKVTTPRVISLTSGEKYRLVCWATIDANLLGRYLEIIGEANYGSE